MKAAVENFEHPAFPCALIMGDVVILELLHREGLLQSGRVPVVFVDTFHLFPETHTLLHRLEVRWLQTGSTSKRTPGSDLVVPQRQTQGLALLCVSAGSGLGMCCVGGLECVAGVVLTACA